MWTFYQNLSEGVVVGGQILTLKDGVVVSEIDPDTLKKMKGSILWSFVEETPNEEKPVEEETNTNKPKRKRGRPKKAINK